jgi:hypothetical protein
MSPIPLTILALLLLEDIMVEERVCFLPYRYPQQTLLHLLESQHLLLLQDCYLLQLLKVLLLLSYRPLYLLRLECSLTLVFWT